jgi:predicted CopG family antitoxin
MIHNPSLCADGALIVKETDANAFAYVLGARFGKACRACLFVYYLCMAFKTLTISDEAHQRLKKHKLPGESFTQVILREIPEPLETAGDVLDFLRSEPAPEIDRRALESLRKDRGRRSQRK